MDPEITTHEPFTVLGVANVVDPHEADFGAIWGGQFMPRQAEIAALSTDGAFYGVWLCAGEGQTPEYVAGMAVPEGTRAPEGLVTRVVAGGHFAVFSATMATLPEAYHAAYKAWLPASGYRRTAGLADIEYYPPDTGGPESPVSVWIPVTEQA
jgi:predicted transcriptional regulator YdeE